MTGLPAPGLAALLLDLDGTLLDIAPTPDAVRVPPGLASALLRLRAHLGGALAIVTGRPIDQVDGLLPSVPQAIAGEHGGAIRRVAGGPVIRAMLPDPPVSWVIEAAGLVARYPGALLEQKQRGFVLHYRAVPQAGPALGVAVTRLVAPLADQFQVMPALMAWEVRPRGADKGTAVHALMAETPFARRLPVFVGDDITDEDGMEAARALGGVGLRVDRWFGGAADVRAWLEASAAALPRGEGWPALPRLGS